MESIFVWGLNHRSDSVAARERLMRTLAPPDDDVAAPTLRQSDWTESVWLATCHRVEIYGVAAGDPPDARANLIADLSALSGLDRSAIAANSYAFEGHDAIRHLFRVAAGLDSMVLGEAQILNQVKRAKESAETAETIGPLLHRLFRQAIRLGKRARTETAINRHPVSMASIGVDRAEASLGSLAGRTALIVGAGKIATLAARRLREHEVDGIRVANRRRETAMDLIDQYDARFVPLGDLADALAEVDLVISASGAPEPLIRRADVEDVLNRRSTALVVIDLALPRDVEPDVAELPRVDLYNVDDLQTIVQAHRDARQSEVAPIERMIDADVDRFTKWLKERDATSLICALRDRAEAIRAEELESTLRRLQLDDAEREALVEQLSRRLLNKLLHQPTVQIKRWAGNGHGLDEASIAELFGLDDAEQSRSRRDA